MNALCLHKAFLCPGRVPQTYRLESCAHRAQCSKARNSWVEGLSFEAEIGDDGQCLGTKNRMLFKRCKSTFESVKL